MQIQRPSGGYDGTDLEVPSDGLKRLWIVPRGRPNLSQLVLRHETLCCHPIARLLRRIIGWSEFAQIKRGAAAKPHVRQLMCEREHLGSLAVRSVNEHERSILINQDEAAKFIRIELAMSVVRDDAIDDDQDARCFHRIAQNLQGISPSVLSSRPPLFESQGVPNANRNRMGGLVRSCRPDKRQRVLALLNQELAHPGLAALHRLNGVKKIRTRPPRSPAFKRPKMRNGQRLFGRSGEEEVPQRSECGLREGFELAKGGLAFALFPLQDCGEPPPKRVNR